MGSTPTPHLANGWLSTFDQTIKGDSVLYSRYMDDVLCSIKEDEINDHLIMINALHPCLKFTCERQCNGRTVALKSAGCGKYPLRKNVCDCEDLNPRSTIHLSFPH